MPRRLFGSWLNRHPYVASAGMVGVLTGAGLLGERFLHAPNLDVVYLLAVLVSALNWGRRPASVTAIASAIAFDYCFIPPHFSFASSDLPYTVTLVAFLAVAFVTSALAADARQRAIEQAARVRAEGMAQAKEEILHKVSHELRTPLSAVVGWTHLLDQVRHDPQQWSRAVQALQRSAQLLVSLVDDLMDASRISSGKFSIELQPVALAPIVSHALDIVAMTATAKGVSVDPAIEPVGMVLGDERRIQQVVTNLVSNAIKFTPPAGRVQVRLSRAGEVARLAVSDTGVGIRRDFVPHVFESFSQADARKSGGGLGLGLAIVKRVVDAHGGEVTVESAGEGRGTTFLVSLPLAEAPAATASPQGA
jgi:signal transduction histidine kinase